MYEWLTDYDFMGDRRLGVKIYDIISANDGDVAIAAAMEEVLERVPDACCLDIGADEGWWSLFARKKSSLAEIIAFEPNPLNYTKLIQNTKNKNIQTVNKAVSDKDGHLFFELGDGGTNSRQNQNVTDNLVKLECTPIRQFIESKEKLVVKIDTEGHDIIIVKTLLPFVEKIDTLIFEFTIYWYENKEEAIQVLYTLQKHFKHMYFTNRRGLPQFIKLSSSTNLEELCFEFNVIKYQVDIIFTNNEFTKIPTRTV